MKRRKKLIPIKSLILVTILLILRIISYADTVNHTYDALNRLTKTVYANGSQTVTTDYVYDKAGNMTQFTRVVEGSADSDADGIPDSADTCPNKPNGPNLGTCSTTSDKPGITCASNADCANGCSSNGACLKDNADTDLDGLGDACDNCPSNCNTQQMNHDNDGLGDVCDPTPGCGGCGQPQCEQQC